MWHTHSCDLGYLVPSRLGLLVVLPVVEDVIQGTDVDRRETRFLTDN